MADNLSGRRKRGLPTQAKAKEIMRDGTVHGNPLTPGQKGLFGLIAGGGTPTRAKSRSRRKRGK